MKKLWQPTFCFLCCTVLLAGCGGDGIERVEVGGKVTLDGQPLENGSILFQPVAEGPSAGGRIENGTFKIGRSAGPSPGKYRVEIVSYRPTGKKIPDSDVPGKMTEELIQVVPERYNRSSELQVDVSADSDNRFQFDLENKENL